MNAPTEFEIGVIYYAGLAVSLLTGILGMVYLSPRHALARVAGKAGSLWNHLFKSTVLISGMLGAMSVSFVDCDTEYPKTLHHAITLGAREVSSAYEYSITFLAAWLMAFLTMRLATLWRVQMRMAYKMLTIAVIAVSVMICYLVHEIM